MEINLIPNSNSNLIDLSLKENLDRKSIKDMYGNQTYDSDNVPIFKTIINTEILAIDKTDEYFGLYLNKEIRFIFNVSDYSSILNLMTNVEMFGYDWWESYKKISNIMIRSERGNCIDENDVIINSHINFIPLELIVHIENNLKSYNRDKNISSVLNV